MFAFDRLSIFHQHQQFLRNILDREAIFFVGGCVRDVLLGITDKPHDIDLTMSGKPEDIRETMHFDEQTLSRFKTDKFGTMTIIPKKVLTELSKHKISYEITPFRTEGSYGDFRHPGEITRSNDLLQDSRRRDFTINCLYACSTNVDSTTTLSPTSPPIILTEENKQDYINIFSKHKNVYIPSQGILVVQDHMTIQQLVHEGNIRDEELGEVIEKASPLQLSRESTLKQPKKLLLVIDPHGGLLDLLGGKIRTVGNPDDRFTEDALRIIRAIRFPNILNQHKGNYFDYDKPTRISMQHNAHLVSHLAKERINQELVKVFKANNPFGYICLLNELGILDVLFPALARCKGDIQPVRYHPFDTFDHTLLTLHACQQLNKNYLVKFAMLYHDVGKPSQYAYLREQQMKQPEEIDMSGYVHHTESSVPLAQEDFQKLGFSNKEIQEICRYIRWHHRPGEIISSNEDQRPKKIRTLLSEVGEKQVLNLIDLAIADRVGQFNPLQPPAVEELKELKKKVKEMHKEEGRFTMKQLAVDGNVLMRELQIAPGPQLGDLLKSAFEWVLTDIKTRNYADKIIIHLKSLTPTSQIS